MTKIDDDTRPKRQRINLTIREDVIAAARELSLNTSKAAEAGLVEAVRAARAARWRKENRAALDAHNARIENSGPLITSHWDEG